MGQKRSNSGSVMIGSRGTLYSSDDYGNVNTYFWIPIVWPVVGGLVGAYVYDFVVRDTLVARGEPPAAGVEERGRTVEDKEY